MFIRRRAVAQGTLTPPDTVVGTLLVATVMTEGAAPRLHLPRQRVRVRVRAVDAARREVPIRDGVEPRVAHGLARRQALLVVVAQQLGHEVDTLLADLRGADVPRAPRRLSRDHRGDRIKIEDCWRRRVPTKCWFSTLMNFSQAFFGWRPISPSKCGSNSRS